MIWGTPTYIFRHLHIQAKPSWILHLPGLRRTLVPRASPGATLRRWNSFNAKTYLDQLRRKRSVIRNGVKRLKAVAWLRGWDWCPNVSHHPTIGDTISNRYLKVSDVQNPQKGDIYQPLSIVVKHNIFLWRYSRATQTCWRLNLPFVFVQTPNCVDWAQILLATLPFFRVKC